MKIAEFADTQLDQLVENLYTAGTDASKGAVVGALVIAASQLPIEAVAAVIPAYVRREAAESKSEE